MTTSLDLDSYYDDYAQLIKPLWLFDNLRELKNQIAVAHAKGGKIVFLGNGASASNSAHAALDLTKQAGVKAITFHDPSFVTAYVNDFGSENWLSEACKRFVDANDVVVLFSVSGESPNLVKAASDLRLRGVKTVSFTGRNAASSLSLVTDKNFFVNSEAYNIVERIHLVWITTVIDMLIGKKVYSVS